MVNDVEVDPRIQLAREAEDAAAPEAIMQIDALWDGGRKRSRVLFLVSWFATVMGCALRAWRHGREEWGNLMLFIARYWLANVVNAPFDVALEGPMLGVWFWSLSGLGLSAVTIYRASEAGAARERVHGAIAMTAQ